MADSVSFDIAGLDELLRDLNQLGARVGGNALISADRAGATVVVKEARIRAPKKTGNLRRNIRSVNRRTSSRNEAKFDIGFTEKAYYGKFMEKGTRYISPRQFLRPAIGAKRDEVIRRIGEKLLERILKAR